MDGLRDVCTLSLGAEPVSLRALHGGDLSQVTHVILSDGRDLVAKQGPLVAHEARMLSALSQAGAPAPKVIAVMGDLLLMQYLPETSASDTGWQALSKALRTLHAQTSDSFGWTEDYAFGAVPIPNDRAPDWVTFWAENRLLPSLSHLPASYSKRLDTLTTRLSNLLPSHPPAALLHGDLWSGNVLFSGETAHLIDPACYFGDAEVDLAMLHLFGAPPSSFDDAYGPRQPEWQTRRAIYQIWPALVHIRLFGAGYLPLLDRLLRCVE